MILLVFIDNYFSKWINYINFGGIMNYEDLVFSEKLAQQRIAQAENILGKKVVQKTNCFCLIFTWGKSKINSSVFEYSTG